MHGFLDRGFVTASDRMCNGYICSKCDSNEQIHDQTDDRAVCPHCRNGYRPFRAGEITDNRDVGCIK